MAFSNLARKNFDLIKCKQSAIDLGDDLSVSFFVTMFQKLIKNEQNQGLFGLAQERQREAAEKSGAKLCHNQADFSKSLLQ